jgi:hemerythrin-like domain-containing protein
MTDLQTETNATIETRLVHDVHRYATSLLAETAGRPSVPIAPLAELRDFVVAMVRHHHESEDDGLWPRIAEVAPELGGELARLSDEHHQLDAELDTLAAEPIEAGVDRSGVTASAEAVRDLVHRHLEHEEPILFPVLRTRLPEQEWDAFSRQVVATSPPSAAPLVLAFLDRLGTPDEVEVVLTNLPEPARALVPTHRREGLATLEALAESRR